MKRAVLAIPALLLLASIGGCGAKPREQIIQGAVLQIATSAPLAGPLEPIGESMISAEKLAIYNVNGILGGYKIDFLAQTDTDRRSIQPALVVANARKVGKEGKVVAYIGELYQQQNIAAIPILNQSSILQVSPTGTGVGVNSRSPVSLPGDPQRHYITGIRSYITLPPQNLVQASAAVGWTKKLGAHSIYVLDDGSLFGRDLAAEYSAAAKRAGLTATGRGNLKNSNNVNGGADLIFYSGSETAKAASVLKGLRGGTTKIIATSGPDGLTSKRFYGNLGSAGRSTKIISPLIDQKQVPPAGLRVQAQYKKTFGTRPTIVSLYAYAATQLVLSALEEAGKGANNKLVVIKNAFNIKALPSAVGTFSVKPNGETTLNTLAGYRISGGRLVFERGLKG